MAKHRNPVKKTILHNRLSRADLLKQLSVEQPVERVTLSFYRYVRIADPHALRDEFYREWSELGVRGRIYLAHEGINAQLSLPKANKERFRQNLEARPGFAALRFNAGIEDDGNSFIKLTIKVKRFIVNDGLGDFELDEKVAAPHLKPLEFNRALEEPGTIIVDMRNHYESEVGRFENAICPDVPTFREQGFSLQGTGWYGLFAPSGTPRQTVAQINAILAAALARKEVAERIGVLGLHPATASPEDFAATQRRDIGLWGPAVKASGFAPTQ